MFDLKTPLLSYSSNVNLLVANYFMRSLPVFRWPDNNIIFTGYKPITAYYNYEPIHFSGWDKNIYTNFCGGYHNYNFNNSGFGFGGNFRYNYYSNCGSFVNFTSPEPASVISTTTQTTSTPAEISTNITTSTPKTSTPKLTTYANESVKVTEPAAVKKVTPKRSLGDEFLKTANKYSNVNEADGSHVKFCVNDECFPGNYGEWCTDFVTYVVKESYKNQNKTVPKGFGTHDVEKMKLWAESKDSDAQFIRTSDKPKKGEYIKQNIKPGDIFILNENGASHIGFVAQVNSDGSFSTIEGNRDDMVKSYTYSPDFDQLSGFIRLT